MVHRATGIGSMPGQDFADSTHVVLGEVGDLPHVVELPSRGPHATMTGRTLGLVVKELGADLQPAGWRLTDAPGIDQRRAASLLDQDLDTVEELTQHRSGAFKVQITGPWTLSALVERPRGDKLVADHGARRDLAQALAEGVRGHIAEVSRRTGSTEVVVQVDEPALPSILAGAIPTASGFSRHRAVTSVDAAQGLDWVFDAILASGAEPVVHCCAEDVPFAVFAQTMARAVSFDVDLARPAHYDDLGAWVDSGRELWLGAVPALAPEGRSPTESDLTRKVLAWWSGIGFSDPGALPDTTVTPACGLAAASPGWARTALELSAKVARNLSGEGGTVGR